MTTELQWAKAFGYLPHLPLDELPTVDAAAQMKAVDHAAIIGMRCGCPDHVDREIAGSNPAKVAEALELPEDYATALVQMHARQLEATGRGSWPAGCLQQYPDNHACTYWVDRDSFPAHYKKPVNDSDWQMLVNAKVWPVESVEHCKTVYTYRTQEHAESAGKQVGDTCNLMDAALLLMEEAFRRVGCAMVPVFTGNSGQHNVHIKSQPIPGGVIGFAYFNDGSCGDHVNHVIDSTWRPALHRLALLFTHEAGHNHNLQHEFRNQSVHRSVMSYSWKTPMVGFSTGQHPYDRPRDESLPELTRYYGGEPVPPIGEPPAPSLPEQLPGELYAELIPGADTIAIRGVLYPRGEYDGTEYIAVPKPGSAEKVYVMQRKPEV